MAKKLTERAKARTHEDRLRCAYSSIPKEEWQRIFGKEKDMKANGKRIRHYPASNNGSRIRHPAAPIGGR